MARYRRFRWSFANEYPEGSYYDRMNQDEAGRLNSYGTLAIVQKEPHGAVLDAILEWEDEQTTYAIVQPCKTAVGYQLTGRRGTAPSSQHVKVAASDDQVGLINWGQLKGVFEGGQIINIPEAEELTGAIPVIDTNEPTKQHIYYLPAVVPPLAMNTVYFESKPSFVVMQPGEMPRYVFWKRKEQYKPSLSGEAHLAAKAAASSAEPLVDASAEATTEVPVEAPVEASSPGSAIQASRTRRSRAPTPEEHTATLVVDTNKAAEAAKEKTKEVEPVWEVFYPQLEQDPVGFLDYYNTPLNGWHGYRAKMMLREVDINRVNYTSPCLAHNHKRIEESEAVETVEATNKSAAVAAVEDTEMEIDSLDVPPPKASVNAASVPSKSFETPKAKPWVQPGPIAHDDPAWKALYDRIDKTSRVRKRRIRPEPVFTEKYCNTPGAKVDPKKAVLTRKLYDKYYARAVRAQREIDARSKCCLACGLKWSKCPKTRYEHYNLHREERRLYFAHCQKLNLHIEPEMTVDQLDPAKVEFIKDVPGLNWFARLEEVLLNLENELLEREQTCRVCDAHIDFGEYSIVEHYNEHAIERNRLRTVPSFTVSVVGSKLVVGTDGSTQFVTPEDSPPPRSYKGLESDHYLLRRDDAERARRKALAGTIPHAHRSPPTTKLFGSPKWPQSSPSDPMDFTEDGPIHSDVVGESTARRAFSPPMVPKSKSPTTGKGNVDFLSNHDQPSSLAKVLERFDTYCLNLDIPRKAVPGAQKIVMDSRNMEQFKTNEEALFVAAVCISLEQAGAPIALPKIAPSNVSINDIGQAITELEARFPTKTGQRRVIAPVDDDSDLYAVPAGLPASWRESMEATVASDYDPALAIRPTSGELTALDDIDLGESEDEVEAPGDFDIGVDDYSEGVDDALDADDIHARATHDSYLPIREPTSARDFTDKLIKRVLENPLVNDVEAMVRDHSKKSSGKEHLDAARILADGSAHGVLRKLNLNLQQAFDALLMTHNLIEGLLEDPDADTNGLSHSQWVQDIVFDHLRDITKNLGRRGSKKTVKDVDSFSGTHVNTLCGPIELYDLWRILDKARIAFEELADHPQPESLWMRKYYIRKVVSGVLWKAYCSGYDDTKRFPADYFIPVKHDGLDMADQDDMEITDILKAALGSGHALRKLRSIYKRAWRTFITLVRVYRAAPGYEAPEVARRKFLEVVHEFVDQELEKDRLFMLKYSPGRFTKTEESQAPISISSSSSESSSDNSLKRKRSAQLLTPTSQPKRKSTANDDPEYQPGTPSPFDSDEISPRLPKAPRKSNDPLYRPGSALNDPTSPPPTPKRTSAQKAANRASRKKEKRKEKKALKAADKKGKKTEASRKVTFNPKPAFKSAPPTPESSQPPTPIGGSVRKATKPAVKSKKTSAKVTKPKAATKKTATEPEAVSSERPQRKAAVEAKKNFGKTKIIG
ncbi:hypothetical protein E4T38_06920 [Aureobasidium subglaciale]|nr:hypothetical protein E4T38_06920 [Aureobasidium subglaciale]KAI5218549.1 hypothetical protein E4T40_06851 [Aureobasidium subglaciale]KAI5222136.1 hypothetical protein E4T41_06771 [Aureobasidium subglaciale]KAI5259702.1 hypothetical protein E4T46_06749 [Aureobasidium subglaciale]